MFVMTRLKSFVQLLMVCILAVTTGCSGDGPESATDNLAGNWYGTRCYVNNGAVKYQNITLRLNSDKTGSMEYEGPDSFSVAYFTWSASGGRLVCKGAYASTSGDLSGDYQMECRIESGRLIPTGQFSTFILTKDNSVMTDGDGNEIESPETQLYTLQNTWVSTDGKTVITFYPGGVYDEYVLDAPGSNSYSEFNTGSYSFAPLNKTLTIKTTLWNVVTLSDKSLVLQRGTTKMEFRMGTRSDMPSVSNLKSNLTSAFGWTDKNGKYTFRFLTDGSVVYFENSFRKYGSWGDILLCASGTFSVSGSYVTCNFTSVDWESGTSGTASYFPDWKCGSPATKVYKMEITASSSLMVTIPNSTIVYLSKIQ